MLRPGILALLLCLAGGFTARAQVAVVAGNPKKISATQGDFVQRLDQSDSFGAAIASLGDLDGNGVPDIAVGVQFDDDGGTRGRTSDTGAVWILFLNDDGTVGKSRKISATEGNFRDDNGNSQLVDKDFFGVSVANLGDFDEDPETVTALAVGASGDSGFKGAVWILFIDADGAVRKSRKFNFEGDDTLSANDNFGISVAGLGDLDGEADAATVAALAVGAERHAGRGAVWVLFLDRDGFVRKQQKISADQGVFTGEGETGLPLSGDGRFGASVADLGDLDGTGGTATTLAVGEQADDVGGKTDIGALWLLPLDAGGRVVEAGRKIDDVDLGGVLDKDDRFGRSVARLRDLEDPGTVTLAVGAWFDGDGCGETTPNCNRGAVYELLLDDEGQVAASQKISATQGVLPAPEDNGLPLTDGNLFGVSVAGLGDFDEDPETVTALAVGATGDNDGLSGAGAVWILFLDRDGLVRRIQKISATEGGFTPRLQPGDSFGSAATNLGDLDGEADAATVGALAVGASGDDDVFDDAGAVWVLSLDRNRNFRKSVKINAAELGPGTLASGDGFGAAAASLGDFDGDGPSVATIAVGAPGADGDSGAVWVVLLNADGTVSSSQRIAAAALGGGTLTAGDGFGSSVTALAVGGVPALAVGAPGADSETGAVYVIVLNADGTLTAESLSGRDVGAVPGDGFGSSVAALDVPGGIPALAVGAPGADSETGAVYVIVLNADGTLTAESLSGRDVGAVPGDGFGSSVASLGDADGDGVGDLLVGASGADEGAGAFWALFLRPDGSRVQPVGGDLLGAGAGDGFGSAVAGLGDPDGDNRVDAAIGAWGDDDGCPDDSDCNQGAVWLLSLDPAPSINEPEVTSLPERCEGMPLPERCVGTRITIRTRITDNKELRPTILFRRAGDSDFLSASMESDPAGLSLYAFTLSEVFADSRGVEYFITVTDDFGQARLPASGIRSVPIKIPNLVTLNPQPGGDAQTAYRLISIPYTLDDPGPGAVLEDELGTYDETEWRFFEPGGEEFPNTSDMVPGKAFWLIVREQERFIDTGEGVTNATDKPFEIPLRTGWNYIGNPFNFLIPLVFPQSEDTLVSLQSGQPLDIRYYDRAWNTNEAGLIPFEGYAVFSEGVDTLLIDPNLFPTDERAAAKHHDDAEEQDDDWAIRILAQSQEARDVDNLAVLSHDAAPGWDRLDRPEPPPVGDYVWVYFPHPEWNSTAARYSTDARPAPDEAAAWTFEVATTIRDKVHLTFEGVDEAPPAFDVWLVDELLGVRQNLREQAGYTLAGTPEPRRLRLVVARRGFAEGELAASQDLPERFELFPNFPNPFNPTTTLRYGVPSGAEVTLVIYDVLGKQVATLEAGVRREAGYHAAVWDGRSDTGALVASGVYVARMQAGRFVQTQTMVLVK